MSKQETLEKVVIDLLCENNDLKTEVKRQSESSMYWFKKFNELEETTKTKDLIKTEAQL